MSGRRIEMHRIQELVRLHRAGRGGFVASAESRGLLLPSRNYLLLRRFTAKEERRRLTASCFLQRDFPSEQVALENHLNYVYHASRELSEDETFGLAALFNSFLLDRYFRTLSGNTQVNATELRTMPLPDLESVARIGRKVRRLKDLSPSKTEAAVLDVLRVNGPVRQHLLEVAG